MTAIIIGIGVLQIVSPLSFSGSKFVYLLDKMPAWTIGWYCIGVGWLRGGALFLNGRMAGGTVLRAITSFLSGTLWAQMGASVYLFQVYTGGPMSPVLPIFVGLVFAEFDATCRALADARFR